MTFLTTKTNDSLFFVVSSCYFFAFYEPAYRSNVIFLVPRVPPLPKGFSVSKMVSRGGGEGGKGTRSIFGYKSAAEVWKIVNCVAWEGGFQQ